MSEHVVTCIRHQKPFKLDMDTYHGHAHQLVKVGVISRMSKTMFNRGCLCRGQKAPFESTLFLDIRHMTPFF